MIWSSGFFHGAAQFSAETDAAGTHAGCDAVVNIVEGASHNEENVRGINLNIRMCRVLASALRRYGRHGALNNLQQRLLHAFTGHVTGDGRFSPPLRAILSISSM